MNFHCPIICQPAGGNLPHCSLVRISSFCPQEAIALLLTKRDQRERQKENPEQGPLGTRWWPLAEARGRHLRQATNIKQEQKKVAAPPCSKSLRPRHCAALSVSEDRALEEIEIKDVWEENRHPISPSSPTLVLRFW